MESKVFQNSDGCPNNALSLYLDGDLSKTEEVRFESHLSVCGKCRNALNSQRKLLSVLNAAFESKNEITLPKDFTRIVVANAESSVSGLRSRKERSIAVLLCCFVFLFLLLGLGADSERLFGNLADFGGRLGAFIISAGAFVIDFATGLVVLIRCVSSRMIFSSSFSVAAAIVFSVFAFLILTRLMGKFGGTQNDSGEAI